MSQNQKKPSIEALVSFLLTTYPITWEYHPKVQLPDDFPQTICPPQFQLGDHLKYTQLNENDPIDRGQVIGFYFCYAPQYRRWMWRYVLWLAENSPSSAWLNATVVWESDLELLEQEHGT